MMLASIPVRLATPLSEQRLSLTAKRCCCQGTASQEVAPRQVQRQAVSATAGRSPVLDKPGAQIVRNPTNGGVGSTPAPASQEARVSDQEAVSAASVEFPRTETSMDIVFVSAEVAPWSKTGGLGDVVGSLPVALARRGHRVMVVAPRYVNGQNQEEYESLTDLDTTLTLDLGTCGQQTVGFQHCHRDGVDYVFVTHPSYERPGNPYADQYGAFGDNVFRYSLLSLAACEAPLNLNVGGHRTGQPPGFPYGEQVLFVANDWHAAMVPSYLAARYRRNGVYKDARSIFAIHNLSHQGVEPADNFGALGLPEDWYEPLGWEFPSWAAINGPAFNILKGAVAVSDRIITVSKGYAWEISTVEGGWGLHDVLASRKPTLDGIVNGIDLVEWNPASDKHTPAKFSADDLSGKAECKAALQKELGLPQEPKTLLVGWIGRLDHQKGPDVVLDALPGLMQRGCQVVMLGSGDARYEQAMQTAESQHTNFRGWVGFNVPISHRIVAGCDVMLMPSRFEPCGLNQLFAMRYGTVPVAHATGGLRDTIQDFNPFAEDERDMGTGWVFTPPDPKTLLQAMDNALTTYFDFAESWQVLMRNGMQRDLSWDRSAAEYEQVFTWAFTDPPVRAW